MWHCTETWFSLILSREFHSCISEKTYRHLSKAVSALLAMWSASPGHWLKKPLILITDI
jgi:hypothetical protein